MRVRLGLAAVPAASLAWVMGCYGYVAAARGEPLAGREAQLWLSDSGAVVLASSIGPAAESLVGRVVTDTGTVVVLAVERVRQRNGSEIEWQGERIAVSRTLIVDAGTRRFSPSRTALFSSILGAGLLAARQAFQGKGSGGGGGGLGRSGGFR